MSDPSGLGEWRSDPSGRHQLRWWDGTAWSDHVADQGETSTDPMEPAAPRVSTETPAAARERSVPRAQILAGIVAVVVVVAGALILLRGGDDAKGFGSFAATLDSATDIEVRTIEVPAKSLVRIRATADAGFRPPIFAVTTRDYLASFDESADLTDLLAASDLDRVIQQTGKTISEPSDLYPTDRTLPQIAGALQEGEFVYNDAAEDLVFAVPVEGTFRILITSADGGSGRVQIEIERYDIGGPTMKDFFANVDGFTDFSS